MRFPSRLDAFSISFRSTRSYNPFPVWFSTNDVSVGRQHGCLLAVCRLYQSQLVPTRLRFQVFYGAGQLYRANLTESSKALSFRCFVQTVDTSQIRYRPQNDSVESPPHSPIYDGRRLNSRRYIYIYILSNSIVLTEFRIGPGGTDARILFCRTETYKAQKASLRYTKN